MIFVVALLQLCSLLVKNVRPTELTVFVPTSKQECFYEFINEKESIFLEFQVVSGGSNDIDLTFQDPSKKNLYSVQHEHYGNWQGTAKEKGIYQFCFSSKHSSQALKRVYFDFIVGDEDKNRIPTDHATGPLTLLESSIQSIHKGLNAFINYLTHQRISDAGDRILINHLSRQVNLWSTTQFLFIIFVCLAQVYMVRSFFR